MFPELTEDLLRAHRPQCEAQVYRAFRDHTPDEWFIFFSFRLVKQIPQHPREHGELDFVVFCPEFGVLVVEVKGGIVQIDNVARRWTSQSLDARGKTHVIGDPLQQAVGGAKSLTSVIRRERGWTEADPHYLLVGTALLFPDVADVTPLASLDRPLPTLGGSSVLAHPARWIREVFAFWAMENTEWQPLGRDGMDAVERLFARRIFVPRPLAHVLRFEHETQIELTQQQTLILHSLKYQPRARISGPAGTGKTLLALQQARSFAGRGSRTLFVCYNRTLSDYLAREVHRVPNLDAFTFHMLCERRVSAVKRELGQDLGAIVRRELGESAAEDIVLPYALGRSTEMLSFRYDAIVVDEGQDFSPAAYAALRKLLKEVDTSPWFIFYDTNQAVYQRIAEIPPIGDAPFPLTKNCRNTQHIHEAAYAFFRGDDPAETTEVMGEPVSILGAPTLAVQAELIRNKVENLIVVEGVNPRDVAVLIAGEPQDSFFQALNKAGPTTGFSWAFREHWREGRVAVDTARRFKGLEATVVLLWGIEYASGDIVRELMYVSLSRARSRLWLVGNDARVRETLRSAAVHLNAIRHLCPQ